MFEVEEWLHSRIGLNFRSGLSRMQQAVDLLGNPEKSYPIIHVTGTNGKGSTIAFMRELFMGHGKKVATFTSPHIVSINDRICINEQPIADADFIRLAEQVKEMEKTLLQTHDQLSFFELLTLIAFLYFREQEVDLVLLEVGIGGLLDTTNVVTGEIAVITSIGLDHQETLGDSLKAIAEQKAGIIKQGIPLVTGRIAPEALAVIDAIAEGKDAPRLAYGTDYHVSHQESVVTGEVFDYTSVVRQDRFQTGLLGLHQVENAGMAIALLDTFCQEDGRELASNGLLAQALEETGWPGRLEVVYRDPLMILDGAHNPHAIKALIATLQERFADYHKEILFTCIKTKALEDMLDLLEQIPDTELTLTHFDDSRATDENVLKEAAKSRNLSYQGWQDFLEQKLTDKKEEKQTVRIVTGSLYFLSQVRTYLMERKNENGYTKD